jgi:MoaA/NifB/PqqE/SkfB family radical SAM enzyme
VLEALQEKYKDNGGIKVVVQTTGDLLTPKIIEELLSRDVWSISVSGMDDFHVGMEGDKKNVLAEKVIAMLEAAGIKQADGEPDERMLETGPIFSMFGASEDSWIGKLWPRGRAWENGLSQATIEDNFCNAWSGGLNFLQHGYAGSEVSIDPTGDVYPCCIKTAHPLGNLTEEPLIEVLDDLAGIPAIDAINAGRPERMGLTHGWDEAKFIAESATTTPTGDDYENFCIGCDKFHVEVLGSVLDERRRERRAQRLGILASTG